MPSPIVTPVGGSFAAMLLAGRCCEARARRLADEQLVGCGPDDVAEYSARLDRCELPRVTDENEPSVRSEGLDEFCHERERHHRGLVDDHHIVWQALASIVAEAAVAVWTPAKQSMEGQACSSSS